MTARAPLGATSPELAGLYRELDDVQQRINRVHEQRIRRSIATVLAKVLARDDARSGWFISDKALLDSEAWPELVRALNRAVNDIEGPA